MNTKLFLTFTSLLIFNTAFCQKWSYKNGENAFDGKFKYAHIQGFGSEFPFNNPILVINCFEGHFYPNIYIRDIGYAGCDNKIIKIKFDEIDLTYEFRAETDKNENNWYLQEIDRKNGSFHQLIKKIASHKKMYIRASSDCRQIDLAFSLNGSAEAINFVLPNDHPFHLLE